MRAGAARPLTEVPAEAEKRFKDTCFRLHFYEKHIHVHSPHARRPSQFDMRIVHAHHLSGTARRCREALPPLVLVGPLPISLSRLWSWNRRKAFDDASGSRDDRWHPLLGDTRRRRKVASLHGIRQRLRERGATAMLFRKVFDSTPEGYRPFFAYSLISSPVSTVCGCLPATGFSRSAARVWLAKR